VPNYVSVLSCAVTLKIQTYSTTKYSQEKRTVMDEFKKCNNPLRMRKVKQSVAYCCAACSNAHHREYEIHEDGALGHSDYCNQRKDERGEFTQLDWQYHTNP
jgi:hypothetical protein